MNAVGINDALLERNAALRVALRRTTARLHEVEAHGKGLWTACPNERCQTAVALLADFVCERCQRAFVRSAGAAGRFCRDCWDTPRDLPAVTAGGAQ